MRHKKDPLRQHGIQQRRRNGQHFVAEACTGMHSSNDELATIDVFPGEEELGDVPHLEHTGAVERFVGSKDPLPLRVHGNILGDLPKCI